MELATILDDCLQRMRGGPAAQASLASYGDQAAELAPMLAVAARLQGLASYRLASAQKLRAKMTLRAALAKRSERRSWLSWAGLAAPARGFAAAAIVALVLFAVAAVTTVAASRPGDLSYRVRVVAERAPVWLQPGPENRAEMELNVADRRLVDVRNRLRASGQADPIALAALLASDEAAADHASRLPAANRAALALRVERHANALTALAEAAPRPRAALALTVATERARAIADRVREGRPRRDPGSDPRPQPSATNVVRPTPTPTPTSTREATVRAAATDAPTATATPAATPGARGPAATPAEHPTAGEQPTREPPRTALATRRPPERTFEPGRLATAIAQTVTALPTRMGPPAIATRQPRPPEVTWTPGRRATEIVATLTALPPVATRPPRPPEATPRGHGDEQPAGSPGPGGALDPPGNPPGAAATPAMGPAGSIEDPPLSGRRRP